MSDNQPPAPAPRRLWITGDWTLEAHARWALNQLLGGVHPHTEIHVRQLAGLTEQEHA